MCNHITHPSEIRQYTTDDVLHVYIKISSLAPLSTSDEGHRHDAEACQWLEPGPWLVRVIELFFNFDLYLWSYQMCWLNVGGRPKVEKVIDIYYYGEILKHVFSAND